MTEIMIQEAKKHCEVWGDTKQTKYVKEELKLPDATKAMKAFQTVSANSEVGKQVKAFEIADYIPLCVISLSSENYTGWYSAGFGPKIKIQLKTAITLCPDLERNCKDCGQENLQSSVHCIKSVEKENRWSRVGGED